MVKAVPVPANLTSCKAEPAVPTDTTDKAVANYIIDLIDAGASCRSKLQAVRDWSNKMGAR